MDDNFYEDVSVRFDFVASTLCIDATSTFTLLATRKGLFIVDLRSPYTPTKTLPYTNSWDVAAAQWNPHSVHANLVASTSDDTTLVWDVDSGNPLLHTLRKHTQSVRDVDWNPHDPEEIVTCSTDAYMHVWDLRSPKTPAMSFCSFSSDTTQVKWNRLNRFIMASSHEGGVRVWDVRKCSKPAHFIAAHKYRIYGMDWSHKSEHEMVTCSQDKMVKLWNITTANTCRDFIQTSAPTWRARFTPFGAGLITISSRHDTSIRLWGMDSLEAPAYSFTGHTGIVKDFAWRVRGHEGSQEYQLVSWSKDNTLRMWKVDASLQEALGHTPSAAVAAADGPGGGMEGAEEAHVATSLLQEVQDLRRRNIPNIVCHQMSVATRTCIVVGTSPTTNHVLRVLFAFPRSYPRSGTPTFEFLPSPNSKPVPHTIRMKLMARLNDSLEEAGQKRQPCLEACVQVLAANFSLLLEEEDKEDVSGDDEASANSADFVEASLPCPRLAGACFTACGLLVCFKSSTYFRSNDFPRLYEDLKVAQAEEANARLAAEDDYLPMTRKRSKAAAVLQPFPWYLGKADQRDAMASPSQSRTNNVSFVDVSSFVPISRALGAVYVLSPGHAGTDGLGSVSGMCRANARAARLAGRTDLVRVWVLASEITSVASSTSNTTDSAPWAVHPFGRKTLQSIFRHYENEADVQTLAMLSCVFSLFDDLQARKHVEAFQVVLEANDKAVSSAKSTASSTTTSIATSTPKSDASWPRRNLERGTSKIAGTIARATRSASPNISPNVSSSSLKVDVPMEGVQNGDKSGADKSPSSEKFQVPEYYPLLSTDMRERCNRYRLAYAEILYQWQFLGKRCEVLKAIDTPFPPHQGITFYNGCKIHKKTKIDGPVCEECNAFVFRCAVCRLAVRGSSNSCLVCGHGGHTRHMQSWFAHETVCPTGCGCECLAHMNGRVP